MRDLDQTQFPRSRGRILRSEYHSLEINILVSYLISVCHKSSRFNQVLTERGAAVGAVNISKSVMHHRRHTAGRTLSKSFRTEQALTGMYGNFQDQQKYSYVSALKVFYFESVCD